MNKRLLSDELFATCLWTLETLTRPTLPNLLESFEGWQYRRRLGPFLHRLEKRQLLERQEHAGQIVYRLTALGKLAVCGGQNAVLRWERSWDGLWRMILFDLPARQQHSRIRLIQWLRSNRFGYLQDSIWIRPDPVTELADALKDFRDDVESLTVMEATCCAGYSNDALIRGSWNFKEINYRYKAYVAFLKNRPIPCAAGRAKPNDLVAWLREERWRWDLAVSLDPMLPRGLWLSDYQGESAWRARQGMLQSLAQQWK